MLSWKHSVTEAPGPRSWLALLLIASLLLHNSIYHMIARSRKQSPGHCRLWLTQLFSSLLVYGRELRDHHDRESWKLRWECCRAWVRPGCKSWHSQRCVGLISSPSVEATVHNGSVSFCCLAHFIQSWEAVALLVLLVSSLLSLSHSYLNGLFGTPLVY